VFKMQLRKAPWSTVTHPVAVSLGPNFRTALFKHCSGPFGFLVGVCKRVAFSPPKPDDNVMSEFEEFVKRWVDKRIKSLPPETDVSFDTWVDTINQPEWRKEELRKVYGNMEGNCWEDPDYSEVHAFMKDEWYLEPKAPRGIYARVDEFKCQFGPYVSVMERELFKMPSFIKYVPVNDRPKYIYNRLYRPGAKYYVTDFSSFEAQFTTRLMMICEDVLYEKMLCKLPTYDNFRSMKDIINGENKIVNKYFTMRLRGTRMSGEMNTSLGNGFSNLMFMKFMCKRAGCIGVKGVVEGDDGLFVMEGEPPPPTEFEKLGLVVKAVCVPSLETASFCGIIFDLDDKIPLTNPYKTLATTPWHHGLSCKTRRSKLYALLRCKALSIYHQYNGHPVLTNYSLNLIKLTMPYKKAAEDLALSAPKYLHSYDREKFLEYVTLKLPERKFPSMGSRLLVEEQFSMTVDEQLRLEKHFDANLSLDSDDVEISFPESWTKNFYDRSTVLNVNTTDYHLSHFTQEDPKQYNRKTLVSRLASGFPTNVDLDGISDDKTKRRILVVPSINAII